VSSVKGHEHDPAHLDGDALTGSRESEVLPRLRARRSVQDRPGLARIEGTDQIAIGPLADDGVAAPTAGLAMGPKLLNDRGAGPG